MVTATAWAQEQKAAAYTKGRPMSSSDRQRSAAALKQRLARNRRG